MTADNQYAYYRGTMNNATGLYATNLQNPETAVRVDATPNGYFLGSALVLADSRTLFFSLSRFPDPTLWRKGRWCRQYAWPSVSRESKDSRLVAGAQADDRYVRRRLCCLPGKRVLITDART